MNDLVPASLTTPQHDPATDTIIVDGWRFARRKPASRLPVPRPRGTRGFPIIPNVAAFPSGLLLATAGGKAWWSADGGTTWKPLAVPWPDASAGNVQRVAGDSNRAVFVYRKDGDPCVPRSTSSNETILVEWTGSWKVLHQPPPKERYYSPFALTEEGIAVMGECDGSDSRVDRIQVMRATPEGWQIRDVLVVDGR